MKLYLHYAITKNGETIVKLKPNELNKLGMLTKEHGSVEIERTYE